MPLANMFTHSTSIIFTAKLMARQFNYPLFTPFPGLKGGRRQTLIASYWPNFNPLARPLTHTISLKDSDKLLVLENKPPSTHSPHLIILVHGLTGSAESAYMRRFCARALKKNLPVLRVNLRGCGQGFGLAKHITHSGRSEDILQVLQWAQMHYPNHHYHCIGISMGANLILKMAGEFRDQLPNNLASLVSLSCPLDLSACAEQLLQRSNRIFDKYFTKQLCKTVLKLHRYYPDLPSVDLTKVTSVKSFDRYYTSIRAGFRDEQEYYQASSSLHFLDLIRVPTFLLAARDDPIIDCTAYERYKWPHHLEPMLTQSGGHLGFIGHTKPFWQFRWMDDVIFQWLTCKFKI